MHFGYLMGSCCIPLVSSIHTHPKKAKSTVDTPRDMKDDNLAVPQRPTQYLFPPSNPPTIQRPPHLETHPEFVLSALRQAILYVLVQFYTA
ncbi:hypothetical protein BGW80DRAFT_657176 [Lactifluus volemus]|nr:hypothetical protein BGW80DRAFT_657176 [Lactifluus volemus]